MLHLGQKLGWVFENRALRIFFKIWKENSIFRQVPHLEKKFQIFFWDGALVEKLIFFSNLTKIFKCPVFENPPQFLA